MAQATNSLVQKRPTFSTFLTQEGIRKRINEVIGGKDGQRFMTAIMSAVTTNQALQECEPMTILSAAFLGESLKLSPSPQLGHYYMVPYNDTKLGRKVATFQLGYKGYLQLAMRSGYYADIDVIEIREGEYKGRDIYTGKHRFEFFENEEIRETLPIIGYMAYFEYTNGFRKAIYWNKSKMEIHADKYSTAFSLKATTSKYPKMSYADFKAGKVPLSDMWLYSSFWYKDFDGMAFKTMLRQLISKWGIMSIEMQKAYNADMAVLDDDLAPKSYVDNEAEFEPEQPKESPELTEVKPIPTPQPEVSSETRQGRKTVKADKPETDKAISEFFNSEV